MAANSRYCDLHVGGYLHTKSSKSIKRHRVSVGSALVQAEFQADSFGTNSANFLVHTCTCSTIFTRRSAITKSASFLFGAFTACTVLPASASASVPFAPTALSTEWLVYDGDSCLTIRQDGTMVLNGPGERATPQRLSVTLPSFTTGCRQVHGDRAPSSSLIMLEWSGGVKLVIWAASSNKGSQRFLRWTNSNREGFHIEFTAPAMTSASDDLVDLPIPAAELTVELDSGSHWYGGAHLLRQLWPLERANWEVGPLYPFDHGPNGLGSVVGTHWVNSRGLLVAVDPETPMLHAGLNAPLEQRSTFTPRYFGVGVQHVTQELLPREDHSAELGNVSEGDGKLRLQARASWYDRGTLHPWQDICSSGYATKDDTIKYDTCNKSQKKSVSGMGYYDICVLRVAVSAHSDVRTATLAALSPLQSPHQMPPAVFFQRSIWTTWATSHADITQSDTVALAEAVIQNGFQPGVLEIDDRWQSRYGDLKFDSLKFPHPKQMIEQLHELGFLVTLWVMPFLQESSSACSEAKRLGYLVDGGKPPSIVNEVLVGGLGERFGASIKVLVDHYDWPPGHWEGGGGGGVLYSGQLRWWGTQPVRAIDLTNDEAVEWFVRRLQKLQLEIGVDGFKFDAGEPCFLPKGALTRRQLRYPGEYTQLWVHKVASCFPLSEVRSSMWTSGYGGLVRMGDRDTVWGVENGLQSLIPALLTSAVLGYPFTLPDMVGGNAYWGQFPDTELMIRWAQASVLMPVVQWSIPPWKVSIEAKEACFAAQRIREKVLLPRIEKLAASAATSLLPICRPIWWLDPLDPETFCIDDQFAIGVDVVVAPVVQQGARERGVYLPRGQWLEWRDIAGIDHCQPHTGPCWIVVEAPLQKLPIFVLVHSDN